MSPTDKKEFEDLLRRNTIITRRLVELMKKEKASIHSKEQRENQFEDPNWPYKQAFRNGYLAGLEYTLNLFRFLEGK